jgi:hypothetical protein
MRMHPVVLRARGFALVCAQVTEPVDLERSADASEEVP